MTQDEKTFLNMAGEFAVASELHRRHVLASVTYGAAKSADVFAIGRAGSKVMRIEVKTTDKRKWPIGEKGTRATGQPDAWVFVLLPSPLDQAARDDAQRGTHAPRFFVLTGPEVYDLHAVRDKSYRARYRERHGRESASQGVPQLSIEDVLPSEGQWSKITGLLGGEIR
jgi:hypothetical protein